MAPRYEWFSHTECEYYPCHGLSVQNCLFCYCPLYRLDCGGDFVITNGRKDCSPCLRVHDADGYAFVQSGLRRLG